MKTGAGLRTRLLVLLGGGLLVLLFGQLVTTMTVLEEREEDIIDEILSEQMLFSLHAFHVTGRAQPLNTPRMALYVDDRTDSTAGIPPLFAGLEPGKYERYQGKVEYHVAVRKEGDLTFVLAYDVSQHEEHMHELYAMMIVAFIIMALLTLLGIYLLSGRVLENLRLLSEQVAEARPGKLARAGMESEVLVLAQALDDYRARQDVLLEREREFSGQLSHEIRTPLSVIRSHAELIGLDDTATAPLRKRAQAIMDQVDRLRELMTRLLRLARAPMETRREPVAVAELVLRIWNDLQLGDPRHSQLDCRIDPAVTLPLDAMLLDLVLRNALDNARTHAEGSVITVSLENGCLQVRDHGAEWSPALERRDGRGLGLGIVRRACESQGWTCDFTVDADGACLSLWLAGSDAREA